MGTLAERSLHRQVSLASLTIPYYPPIVFTRFFFIKIFIVNLTDFDNDLRQFTNEIFKKAGGVNTSRHQSLSDYTWQ